MPQTKCNCKNCRRLIGIDIPVCPFCGTPNTFYEQQKKEAAPVHNSQDSSEISIEEMESMFREPVSVKRGSSDTKSNNDGGKTQSNEAFSPIQEAKTISTTPESHRSKVDWEDEQRQDDNSTYNEMFNNQGKYQANYDGYYNDTLPKLQNEIDKTLAGREKTILKVFFSLMGIVAIIVYLVLTN